VAEKKCQNRHTTITYFDLLVLEKTVGFEHRAVGYWRWFSAAAVLNSEIFAICCEQLFSLLTQLFIKKLLKFLRFLFLYSVVSTASVVYWSEFLPTDPEIRVRFPALLDFLRSSGSGTESTQPREYNEELFGRKTNGSGLESLEYGSRGPSR
jgi:hypothetical protein